MRGSGDERVVRGTDEESSGACHEESSGALVTLSPIYKDEKLD